MCINACMTSLCVIYFEGGLGHGKISDMLFREKEVIVPVYCYTWQPPLDMDIDWVTAGDIKVGNTFLFISKHIFSCVKITYYAQG